MAAKREPSTVIAEARRQIEDCLAALPIFSRQRGQALHHYFAVLEVEQFAAGAQPLVNFGAHRAAHESSILAIPAITQRCPSNSSDQSAIDEEIFREAYDLFDFCRRLETVQYNLRLAEKGQFDVFVAKREPRITFAYASSDADHADSLLRPYELQERMGLGDSPKFDIEAHFQLIELIKQCLATSVRRVTENSIEYEYSTDLISVTKRLADSVMEQKTWELEPSLIFGSYTLGDVNRFWSTMQALSVVHEIAHYVAMGSNLHAWPIGSIVQLRRKADWTDIVANVSNLSSDTVQRLLDLHTYRSTVAEKTPALQPLHYVSSELFGAPAVLILGTDHERNFLKLVNRHPDLREFRDVVNRSKEPLALSQLEGLFSGGRFITKKQVLIPSLTDADLLIYERNIGFVLIVQHKWLIGPDTADESAANDDELQRGVIQGKQARDFWRSDHEDLRARLGLDTASPISEIEAVVVSRGAEPTGFVGRTSPPIVTEKAFRSLLSGQSDLGALWAVLNQRPDHQAATQRVTDTTDTVKLAGYDFVFPALAVTG